MMRKLLIGLTAFWIVVAFGGGAWLSQRLQPEAGPWQYMYLIVACMSWLTLALLCGALVRLWPEPEGERIKFEKRPESESPQIDQIVRFYWSGKTDVAWTKLINRRWNSAESIGFRACRRWSKSRWGATARPRFRPGAPPRKGSPRRSPCSSMPITTRRITIPCSANTSVGT
jgi:hypothetical protein